MKWKKKALVFGLFTFRIQPADKSHLPKWEWFEENTSWSDCKRYENREEAKAACEKWIKKEVFKMNLLLRKEAIK